MNAKKLLPRLVLPTLIVAFALSMVIASPAPGNAGPYITNLWYKLIKAPDAQLTALLTHEVDQGGVPRPVDLPVLRAPGAGGCPKGFTITTTVRIGYTMFFENNIVYPTSNMGFRKAINRLVDKDYIVSNIYAPTMGRCDFWLPPPSICINPDTRLPSFNPGADPTEIGTGTATAYLNEAGFTMSTDVGDVNPAYDATKPWSAPRLRIDPNTGEPLASVTFITRPTSEAPLVYEMSVFMADYLRKAGLQVTLDPKVWLEFLDILTNEVYDDYTIMIGVGIVWGSKSPDILHDFLRSDQVPLWNVWNYANEEMDYWADVMKGTLDYETFQTAAYKMQELAARDEPYFPLLLWNMFSASTGPYGTEPGVDAIVNNKGVGAINNFWSLLYSRRENPLKPNMIRIQGAEMQTHNPLMANDVPSWQILTPVLGGTIALNPYSLEYWYMGMRTPPVQVLWVGPDGVEGTADDGMTTTVRLRNDLYWDDGVKVTSADWQFTMEMLKDQNNARYRSYWRAYHHTQIINATDFIEYSTERFIFRFEGIDTGFLCPKHIWESFIAGPDGKLHWEDPTSTDDRHHSTWIGYKQAGPGMGGTNLVGMGAFYYPLNSWQPTSAYITANTDWWGGKLCKGDVDMSRLTELPDLSLVLDAQGAYPGLTLWEKPDSQLKVEMLGPATDIAPPAQIVDGTEIGYIRTHFGHRWGPGWTPEV